jgi:adenylate cyclase
MRSCLLLPRWPAPNTPVAEIPSNMAVLFADVSGSTKLYEALGDVLALETIGRCVSVMSTVCVGHGGRVVKTIGDEVMAVFPTADKAAQAAAEMQVRIHEQPPVGSSRLGIRVGFHVGKAIEAEGDVFGDSVNVAARMAALAKREQVILSSHAADALAPWLRTRLREVDTLSVKGKTVDIGIFELIWQDSDEDLTAVATRWKPLPARIVLRHGTMELVLGDTATTITLGRDTQNDIVLADRKASRLHARLERRRDKFVLVDQSSNGTFVTVDGEPEIMLRREELMLRGRGHVTFGHAYLDDPSEFLGFSCVD